MRDDWPDTAESPDDDVASAATSPTADARELGSDQRSGQDSRRPRRFPAERSLDQTTARSDGALKAATPPRARGATPLGTRPAPPR